jgi:predicted transcriptional regulator
MFAQNSDYSTLHAHESARFPQPHEQHGIVERTSLVYNITETQAEFQARQRHAYNAGRQAWQERRMPAYLIPFYEALVERVGANNYTWVSEETLAEVFQVDVSTIKRWIARLVRAGLIRRQRQFATSSRTYITAYDPATMLLDGEAATITVAELQTTRIEDVQPSDDQLTMHTAAQEDQEPPTEGVSFRRRYEPSFGAHLRPDPNTDHLNLGSGGKHYAPGSCSTAPDVIRILEQEGVHEFYLAPVLRQRPVAELTAISRYLDTQHNVRDRAKLFAALACRDFGAQLLAGRKQQAPQRRVKHPIPARSDDHLKYVSGSLAPYIQGGGAPHAESVPAASDTPTLSALAHPDPSGTAEAHVWQQIRDQLRHALPASEFMTWFDQAVLLDLDARRAVIGTPNIFVREHVEEHYQDCLGAAFQALYGPGVRVQVVIGG